MLVVWGSVEIVDIVVLVVDGCPKEDVSAVVGKDDVGSILVVACNDSVFNDCAVFEIIGVVAKVNAGDVGFGFLTAAKNEMYYIKMQMKRTH